MKAFLFGFISILFSGCCFGMQRVEFVYFNLSPNEIWVTKVVGLPSESSPGRLKPTQVEDQLSEKSMTFFEIVRVADKFKIIWKEGGTRGWPGGLKPGEHSPAGINHEIEFKRSELGIPAKMENGRVQFTYLGADKWRVKLLDK